MERKYLFVCQVRSISSFQLIQENVWEHYKMFKERRWSAADITPIAEHYASSVSVYFVSEGRKCLVICDSERHMSVVWWLNGQWPLPCCFAS
jgi:hypothetical protein